MTYYTAIRIWTKSLPSKIAFDLVEHCLRKGLRVKNFDLYGDDGHSYRIDIRVDGPIKRTPNVAFFSKWDDEILRVYSTEWREPEQVKLGHDAGSLLAIRFHRYGKVKRDTTSIMYIVILIMNQYWAKIDFPYWQKEYDEAAFRKAVRYMTKGVKLPSTFEIIERTMHNFMNNLGFDGRQESWVWSSAMHSWWITQMKWTRKEGEQAYSIPSF